MKITVFNGSPQAERGNTNIMVEEFLIGAKEAKAEVENIFLAKKKIHHCTGCFSCWIKTPGKCVIDDDMKELIVKLVSSDIVVFATPLYVDNVTGIMKNFMDRFMPILDPHMEKDKEGECRHPSRHGNVPKIMVISNCGFPEQSHFQVLRLLFKRIAKNMSSELIGEIYREGGAILKNPPLLLKPLVWKYKKTLRKAGREIIESLKLSEETIAQLEKPMFQDDQYIKGANEHFEKVLTKLKEKQREH